MNNRLIPWLMATTGGFLIWSAIKNKNPVELAKAIVQGKSPNDVPGWGEAGIVGVGPVPMPGTPGSAPSGPPSGSSGPPSATTPPTRPVAGSDPIRVY